MEQILAAGLESLGIYVPGGACENFRRYYELLDEKNKVMNLTAITGEENTARMHFLDCAAVLTARNFQNASVIDVGSGAGFPGLPMRILTPGMKLTVLDSQKKRVDFVRSVCDELGFDDVQCIHARAEEQQSLFGSFDYAVSRAVARLNVLCELCLPFVKVGGAFLAMKGSDYLTEEQEAHRAIKLLGGRLKDTFKYTIPGTDIVRSITVIEKVEGTPKGYPRRFAKIQKTPL